METKANRYFHQRVNLAKLTTSPARSFSPRHAQGTNRGDNDMFKHIANSRRLWLGFALAGSVATASAAVAGECPADKMKPNVREMVDYKPVGVTDVTLGSIDLEKQPAQIKDRELRFRKLTIEPGGIVPWHS